MIKIENVDVVGWEHAIRGMRNPKNSWAKSDSFECGGICDTCKEWSVERFLNKNVCNQAEGDLIIGANDYDLMMRLANGGPVHAKYRRMIVVYLDITAPLYWWKEFDTYKVGTVANSCSTMHKIHAKEFTLEDFSCEHLFNEDNGEEDQEHYNLFLDQFEINVIMLNRARERYLETKDKKYWWQMIQLLPTSYNQKRTVMLNYEVLSAMHHDRKNHKLDEWREFCKWIETLPYSKIITGEE